VSSWFIVLMWIQWYSDQVIVVCKLSSSVVVSPTHRLLCPAERILDHYFSFLM